MSEKQKNRLVILLPFMRRKSPLDKALAKFFPEQRTTMQPLVLYNNRTARPGELDGVDYHFHSCDVIENLKNKDQFVVMDVHEDLQALDLQELLALLPKGNVFFEHKNS